MKRNPKASETESDQVSSKPERAAYSPAEFAALFGRKPVWAYRKLYAGKVNAIVQFGRTMIPASEVNRILESATPYAGRKATPSSAA